MPLRENCSTTRTLPRLRFAGTARIADGRHARSRQPLSVRRRATSDQERAVFATTVIGVRRMLIVGDTGGMKLAEALALRADAARRVEQLRARVTATARYQEGE